MLRETVLVGSPNSGKSLLFNRLTGLSQKVANFPVLRYAWAAESSGPCRRRAD